jgi:hypothetical protein
VTRRGARGPRAGGYVLAEALISAAIAAVTAGLSITLLAWSVRSVAASQASLGAVRVLGRVYEESRLLPPGALGGVGQGQMGRYHWTRIPRPSLDSRFAAAPVPVRMVVSWTQNSQVQTRELDAVIAPGGVSPQP